MNIWTIRPVEEKDQPVWAQMRLALWPDTALEDLLKDLPGYFQAKSDQAAFVAETAAGALIGFVEASLRAYADGCDTSPVGYIEGWYVAETWRLQGVGAALVAAAEAWAREQGCTEMGSDCLLDNELSLRAHLGLGYEETDRLICLRKNLR